MQKILLTGGAGYIGSHTAIALIEEGYEVVIADDLSNSYEEVVERILGITGVRPGFYEIDVTQKQQLDMVFEEHRIDGVIHFAGYKAVGESVDKPVMYYRNNIDSTLTLLEAMVDYNVNRIVFSSSATVYGEANMSPLVETMTKSPCSNPYGWTKSFIEQILTDASAADNALSVVAVSLKKKIGAHESGLMGEDPQGIPNNLMPYITQVAIGKRPQLTVFGDDYDTPDGTCLRDYIHVMDLAGGHVKALEYTEKNTGTEIFNLGTGNPYSVLDVIQAFESVIGRELPHSIGPRRQGDLAEVWADASKADRILGWKAKRGLEEMCRDSWNWQSKNPNGYRV